MLTEHYGSFVAFRNRTIFLRAALRVHRTCAFKSLAGLITNAWNFDRYQFIFKYRYLWFISLGAAQIPKLSKCSLSTFALESLNVMFI
jgi:hypothetical protein